MAKRKIETSENQTSLFSLEQKGKNNYTDEQKEFVEFEGNESILLSATAGSGKTFSSVERLKFLLEEMKVDPSRIIFFSFTTAATKELQRRIGREDVEIRTIHSFCGKVLTRLQKGKAIVSFYDFIEWFKKNHRPRGGSKEEMDEFEEKVSTLYEETQFIESQISSFKLQQADGIKCKVPEYWSMYRQFLIETKSRDFSDMLIEVRELFKEDRYLNMFKNSYDYIFVDEYQDTSSIQMQILLSLNAKYYYLIGDENQCLVEGTRIHTREGIKNIEEIHIGDFVLSAIGNGTTDFKRVTDVFKKEVEEEILKITTASGREICSTSEHSFFVSSTEEEKKLNIIYVSLLDYTQQIKQSIRISKPYHIFHHKVYLRTRNLNEDDKKWFEQEGIPLRENHDGFFEVIAQGSFSYDFFENIAKKLQERFNLQIKRTSNLSGVCDIFPAYELHIGMNLLFVDGDIKNDPISKIERINHKGFVYDLNIQETHNFVANGIVSHNSIYGYSGSSCRKIESMLKARRKTVDMNLTVNFRSDKMIVENSNKHSSLVAKPNTEEQGYINKKILYKLDDLIDVLSGSGQVAVLVRTNRVIKKLEEELLKRRIPMRYFNYITNTDIDSYHKEKMSNQTKSKFDRIIKSFDGSMTKLLAFLKSCEDSKKFVTSIHKSKGLEFETCVVVNSISEDILEENGILSKLSKKQLERISFDPSSIEDAEAKNIHYVAVSRSKHKLFYMIYDK